MNAAFEIIPFTIEISGEVRENNLAEVMPKIREWLESINRKPQSDEEFGDAEIDVKRLAEAEKRLKEAKDKAISDAASIQELFKSLDDASEEIRVARLELEKVIAGEKEKRKAELIAAAMAKLECAPRLRQSVYGKSVADAIKGKRTIETMEKALDVIVTVHNGCIAKNRAAIASFEKAHGADLTMDKEDLEVKSPDSVDGELRRRFEAKKASEERNRLEAEAAKAKAEAEAAKQAAKAVTLPDPPKIGSIPTGSNAAPPGESNVVPFAPTPAPETSTLTEAQEWAEMTATVKSAFGLIKAHRERLTHESNTERMGCFGRDVNAAWKNATVGMEVAK